MEMLDYMIWKVVALAVLAFVVGIAIGSKKK